MTKLELIREIELITNTETGTVGGPTELKSLKQWDSLAVVSFMVLADEKLGLALDAAEVGRAASVSDLIALVSAKLSASG